MTKTGIYKIQNKINNKIYIGQSIDVNRRWQAHKRIYNDIVSDQYNKPLYRAFRKYGIENFIFSILEECKVSELNDKEKYWIKYYDSINPLKGYNLTEGGDSPYYRKLSLEKVQKIREELLYSNKTQEEIAKEFEVTQQTVSAINLGKSSKMDNFSYPLRKQNRTVILCQNCKKIILQKNKTNLCQKCYLKKIRGNRPLREQLKEDIHKMSFVAVGKKYNVTDNAIRKWCKYYNLPNKSSEIKQYSQEEWEKM